MTFTSMAVGGQERILIWTLENYKRSLYENSNAFIFVINGQERFDEAQEVFEKLKRNELSSFNKENGVLLVLVNKKDLKSGIAVEEVIESLKLKTEIKGTCVVKECNALVGTGLHEAMEWLYTTVKKNYVFQK
jgi:signal recognition particle receptor subunit beta